jgi:Glyoxalase/Bleomycin resistance protein/Dioxygenase superfamily
MMVSVRYIVEDVDEAIAFYRDLLGFDLVMRPAPPFAMLSRGDLRLLLNAPTGHRPRQMGGARSRAAGTASRSRSPTSRPRWTGCVGRGPASEATSSRGWAATRSWSMTLQGMPSSCSNPGPEGHARVWHVTWRLRTTAQCRLVETLPGCLRGDLWPLRHLTQESCARRAGERGSDQFRPCPPRATTTMLSAASSICAASGSDPLSRSRMPARRFAGCDSVGIALRHAESVRRRPAATRASSTPALVIDAPIVRQPGFGTPREPRSASGSG